MSLVKSLSAALGAVAITLVAAWPQTSAAQTPVKFRLQSSFPPSSIVMDGIKVWAERVKIMAGNKIDIEVLPAGTVVPAFEVLDATHKGVIDAGFTAAAYWTGKHRAAALMSPTPGGPFGMDEMDMMGWFHTAGGLDLYNELYQKELKRNIVVIPVVAVGNQVFGWFKSPVKSWEDLKGRKCRQTGLTAEVFSKAGMNPVNMPGGEIVPAAERGVIECAEWSSPADDMKIGFQTVWKHFYAPSVHEPSTILELLINGDTWNKLGPDIQAMMKTAAWEATFMQRVIFNMANVEALAEMKSKHGVTVHRTPDDILKKILETWDAMAAEEVNKNAFFKKVYDSQRAYASKVVPMRISTYPDYNLAAKHYWPDKK